MTDLRGFPFAEVHFDREGVVEGSTDDARALAASPAVTDLVVLVHGWNNDAGQARSLYDRLAGSMRTVLDGGLPAPGAGTGIGFFGAFWPSKAFQDAAPAAGPAAGVSGAVGPDDVRAQIEDLRTVFGSDAEQKVLDSALVLVPALEDRATARNDFAELLRSLLDPGTLAREDGPAALFESSGATVMDRLAVPARLAPPAGSSGSAAGLGAGAPVAGPGGAAGIFGTAAGIFGAARNLLNYTTFYEMKDRSGQVGRAGLAPLLTDIGGQRPGLRLHLVGHSFGARLVSATGSLMPAGSLRTVSLLQAAYSHFGLAADWDPTPGAQPGAFAALLGGQKVSGPILATHTVHDTAVGIAYAVASRLAGQIAAGVGDANDEYGGMGRNGAQRTQPVVPGVLRAVGEPYAWTPGSVHNLLADAFISDHSDVAGPQVAYALLHAMHS